MQKGETYYHPQHGVVTVRENTVNESTTVPVTTESGVETDVNVAELKNVVNS